MTDKDQHVFLVVYVKSELYCQLQLYFILLTLETKTPYIRKRDF